MNPDWTIYLLAKKTAFEKTNIVLEHAFLDLDTKIMESNGIKIKYSATEKIIDLIKNFLLAWYL